MPNDCCLKILLILFLKYLCEYLFVCSSNIFGSINNSRKLSARNHSWIVFFKLVICCTSHSGFFALTIIYANTTSIINNIGSMALIPTLVILCHHPQSVNVYICFILYLNIMQNTFLLCYIDSKFSLVSGNRLSCFYTIVLMDWLLEQFLLEAVMALCILWCWLCAW